MNYEIEKIIEELETIQALDNEIRLLKQNKDNAPNKLLQKKEDLKNEANKKFSVFKFDTFIKSGVTAPNSTCLSTIAPPQLPQVPQIDLNYGVSVNKKSSSKKVISGEKNDPVKGIKNMKISVIIGTVGVLFMLLYLIFSIAQLTVVAVPFAMIGLVAFGYFAMVWFSGGKKFVNEVCDWDEQVRDTEKKYNEWFTETDKKIKNKDTLVEDYEKLDKVFFALVNDSQVEGQKIKKELYKEIEEATVEAEKTIKNLEIRIEESETELAKHNIINKDLYPEINRILKFLKLGRAETLKEAINMSFEEIRQEEEEAERRREAEKQRKILERQVEQEREHQKEMEYQAREQSKMQREHNLAMERAASAQAEATKKLAAAPCAECQNKWNCTSSTKKSATSNCPMFKPRHY